MEIEGILTIVATIFGTSGVGTSLVAILRSIKSKKEIITAEKDTKEKLKKIDLQLASINAKVDLIISFNTRNENKNHININNQNQKGESKNE